MREVLQIQQCPAATAACTRNRNGQVPCLHGALKHVTDQGLLSILIQCLLSTHSTSEDWLES